MRTRYWLLLATTAVAPILWGTTYIVTTELLPADRPLIAAKLRTLPAGLLLLLWIRCWPTWQQLPKVLFLSLLNIAAFQALLFIAAYRLPGGIAAVIGSAQPLIIMLLLWLFDRVRPSWISVVAVLASMVGMAMLLIRHDVVWDGLGLLAAFGGAVVMACGLFLTQRWRPDVSNLTFTAWQLLFGGLLLSPLAMAFESWPAQVTMNNMMGYAYLALFGSLFAYALYFRGIARLPGVAVSILGVFSPITATVLGWWLLGQSLSMRQLAGLIVVLIAVLIVQWQNRAQY